VRNLGHADAQHALPATGRLCGIANLPATAVLTRAALDGARRFLDTAVLDHRSGDRRSADAVVQRTYVITFNGEIYNYPELRDELRAEGVASRHPTPK
jgi:asparagine synthetase B (glutamine-hydrolysing)